jgi:hypothetical protein
VKDISQAEESASKSPRIFQAHKHEIACIALDPSSHRLATASIEVAKNFFLEKDSKRKFLIFTY